MNSSGNLYGIKEVNLLNSVANAKDLSKTKHQNIITDEKLKENASKVFANEVALEADRSIPAIGRFPSDFHNYEMVAKGLTEFNDVVSFSVMQAEMVINLFKPSAVLFTNAHFLVFPHEYLSAAFDFDIFVPNDENVYREEMVISNTETSLNVLDAEDIQTGNIPNSVNLIVTNGQYLTSNPDQDILLNFWNALPSGSAILILASNDYINLYSKKTQHPLWDLHEQIKELPGAFSYHIPTFIGFTIVIKN